MAKRRSLGKGRRPKKIEPAVKTMSFTVPNGTSYVDLSLAASIANRRFYRQGLEWAVAGFTIFTVPTVTGGLDITKVPETWMASNAWHKSFAMWRKMNDQVLDDEPSIAGKYADFKVYADQNMIGQDVQCKAQPNGLILTPQDYLGGVTNGDYLGAVSPRADWEYSTITIPNDPNAVPTPGVTEDYSLHMVGINTVGSKAVIQGYARSRARPQSQDPNVPTNTDWMTEMFDVGDQLEELRTDIVEDNDRPPYAVSPEQTANDFYPGAGQEFPTLQIHDNAKVTTTTVGGKTGAMGGTFQCGLIRFDSSLVAGESAPSTCTILIHMVAGPHRGYMCRPMQDV